MRITSKGQVTIPGDIRRQAGFAPGTDVEFVVDGSTVRIIKAKPASGKASKGQRLVSRLRGSAQVKLSTDEVMEMTRGWDKEPPGVLD